MMLAKDANMALAQNTKSNYNTVKNNIASCEHLMGYNLRFPWGPTQTIQFVAYLLYTRKVKAKTAMCQLSGVRMAHLESGFECPSLRPPMVTLILTGREHWENVRGQLIGKPKRAAITPELMCVIKRKIIEADWLQHKKHLVWAVCTLLWNGSLRVHEILSQTKQTYDPAQTAGGKPGISKYKSKWERERVGENPFKSC